MRIAFESESLRESPSYPLVGVGKSQLLLMKYVHRNYPDVELLCFSRKAIREDLPFPVERVRWSNTSSGHSALQRRLGDCDLLHYHSNGGLLSFLQGKRTVLVIHDVLPLETPGDFIDANLRVRYVEETQRNIDAADLILTVSAYSRGEIERNFNVRGKTIHILHLAPTLETAEAVVARGDYYLYCGGYHRRKGLIQLLQSFIEAPVRRRLVFVGRPNYFSPWFRMLTRQATAAGILTEMGYVSDDRLRYILSHARAMIYPSKYEGFGLPPLEAMAVGTPVIATNFSSLPEVCGDAALYCDPDRVGDLERAIGELENSPGLAKTMVRRGYENLKRFDWNATAKKYMQIITGEG
ncbi:MAG: glycosyltransferase family 4 protein [Rickettsiales bacterium]|jgi:glycosyltransferase involved in cell wall biosynthesis|nr:glycosyltransferase family 4 protein [Rickettsiales bacterium]